MLRELRGVLLTLPLKQRCPILPKDGLPFPWWRAPPGMTVHS